MKQFNIRQVFFTTFLIPACQLVSAQCVTPTVTASGPTLLCTGNSVTLSAPAGNSWVQKANTGGSLKIGAVGFCIGNKGYTGTGTDTPEGSATKKDFWEYDPATNVWTQKADFGGQARSNATGFSVGTKGYIGTGTLNPLTPSASLKDFWEYDPATNVWTRKADFGGLARCYATGFSIGTKGYIGTGTNGSSFKDFWEYDPATDAWVQKTDFGGTARFGTTSFSSSGKGYIGTGIEGGTSHKRDLWAYDPLANTWTQKADFGGVARGYAAGFGIGSKGYIGTGSYTSSGRGGSISFTIVKDFWEYNTETDVWTKKADYSGYGRDRAVGLSIAGKGYIGSGRDAVDPYDGVALPEFWEFDPGYTYVWAPGGATTASITVSTTGNYSVTATNTAGCSATSAVVSVRAFSSATVYVDASSAAAGDGASWATAFRELSDALDLANQCSGITQILVAKGTYKPTGNGNREASFTIRRGGLKIYGGYPSGGGTRNVGYNPTIMSGDIGTAGNDADNSYHVLVMTGLGSSADSLVLDGFTITKGKANGSGYNMYSNKNTFQSTGSGIVITANNAAGNKLVVRNCAVAGNSSADDAGGIYCRSSSPLIVNCVVTGNSSGRWGGGMLSFDGSAPRVVNCTFASNSAVVGGGICVYDVSATITNCIIWGNSATYSGPGIGQIADAVPVVTYSDVQGEKFSGAGNKSVNPLFIYPASPAGLDGAFGTWDDGLIPWPFIVMPAVNAGSNAAVPSGVTTDIRGWARIKDGRVDMGAYEYQDIIGSLLGLNSTDNTSSANTVSAAEAEADVLKVYPVPAKDMVWLKGSTPGFIGKQMQLTNLSGSVLQTIRITQWPQRIDVSSLPPGLYLLRLPDNTVMKVIRQ